MNFALAGSSILKPPTRYDYLLPGRFSLCNIAQVAEDWMLQFDPGAHCIPRGEMLGEIRQSESWLARRTGIDCGLSELISHLASILGGLR